LRNRGSFGEETKETHREKNICILLEGFTEENMYSKLIICKYFLVPKLYMFTVHLLKQFVIVSARSVIYILTSPLISLLNLKKDAPMGMIHFYIWSSLSFCNCHGNFEK